MIYIFYGAAGVLAVLALLAAGALLGWKGREAWNAHTRRAVAAEATEEERRQLLAQQRAFEGLLNYSAETAYGQVPELEELVRDGG